jgi:ornithine carbamoyltransferase
VLEGQGVALLFEKASNRTRNSSEMAAVALGGHPVYIQGDEVGIDVREPAEDVARTLACYHSVLCARVIDHGTLVRMAAALDGAEMAVPVINLLSDRAHPCQAVADLLTLDDAFGHLDGLTVAYVGDWNNVARSLALALARTGAHLRLGCPDGYGPAATDLYDLDLELHHTPREAVKGADAVYSDTWTSMGQEAEAAVRRQAFDGWTVTEDLMAQAADHAIFMHCLPAHRGEEVTDDVLDGPQSRVWPQALNRLHAARGVLAWLLADVRQPA